MFFLDDLLLSPLKGFVFIAEKIREAALAANEAEAGAVTKQLSELYGALERGEITEEEFDEQEETLLERLEALAGDEDDEEEDGDEDDEPRSGSSFTVSLLGDEDEDEDDSDEEEAA